VPDPAANPAPDQVICTECFGWGTVMRKAKKRKFSFNRLICEECSGTGKKAIPTSETENVLV
jgi:DnaJ-class molecular chaperone